MKKCLFVLLTVVLLVGCSFTGDGTGNGIAKRNDAFSPLTSYISFKDFSNPNKPAVSYVPVQQMWVDAVEEFGGTASDPHISDEVIRINRIETPNDETAGKSYIYYLESDTITAGYGRFTELVATSLDIEGVAGNFAVGGDITVGDTARVTKSLLVSEDVNVTGLIIAEAASESTISNLFVDALRVNSFNGYAKDRHFGLFANNDTIFVPVISAANITADRTDVTVASILNVTGDIEAAADVNVQGSIHSYSDRKFKTNIKYTTNILAKLLEVEVVVYDFVNPTTGKVTKQIGVVAQDVQKLGYPFNLLVKKGAKGLVLDYSRLSVFAIKALQESEANNKKLAKQVATLESRLNKIEKVLSNK